MAPQKKAAKKPGDDSTSTTKKLAPKQPSRVGKKSRGAAKKPSPKKPMGKTPTEIRKERKETEKKSAKAASKADILIKDEDISNKPAGNTRAATKKESKDGPTEPWGKASTAPTTTKTSKNKSKEPEAKTRSTTKEPPLELVDIPSEDDAPAANLKRKRATEDKWTETTDLPVPKSPKLDEGSSPSSFKGIRKLRTLEDLASEGWDTQDFISEVCCVDTVDPSRIPSPLADLADRADGLKHVVDNHVHPQVSFLFNCIQGKDTARLISYLDEGPTGAFGAFQADHMGPHFFIVPPDTPEILLPLNRRDGTIGGTHLDVHVRKNARTDEIGYFIVNKQRNLFINENLIARKSAAGPLPDFAVIQIGYWVMFWWRTRAAMDYRPMALSRGVKEVEEVDATKESPPTPPNSKEGENSAPEPSRSPPGASKGGDAAEELSSSPTSGSEEGEIVEVPTRLLTPWKETLYFRLRRHDNDRVAAGDRHVYHEIGSASGMNIDDVLFAVATIWKPLRNQGTDFAFAGADVFEQDLQQQVAAEILQSVGVVGEGKVFIMPLFFPPDQEVVEAGYKKNLENKANEENAKGKAEKEKARTGVGNSFSPLGHFLLAVAERDSAEPNNINIQILDSLDGIVDPDLIRRRATEIARVWVGTEVEAGLEFHVVPQQTGNSNACGLYVILNAWMIMLGIPIRNAESRRGGCGLDLEFVKDGLKIVNLALAGFMDSKTIRAFLCYYGYTDLEGPLDPLDQEANTENAVIAARMDKRRFERALAQLPSSLSSTTSAHRSDSTDRALQESPSPFSSTSSAPSTDTTGLQDAMSESSIQQFMEQAHDASLEEAKECLEATDGDIGEAIVLFAEHQSQLGGPAEAKGAPEC